MGEYTTTWTELSYTPVRMIVLRSMIQKSYVANMLWCAGVPAYCDSKANVGLG